MRMSCNGCRVLRKGCSEDCSIRPCLLWIKSPESQANATVFLAKFYGRAGLMNLINAGPDNLRPAIFRSLLYEACGRIVNPIYGSVGLLWSGSWQLCQSAVEAVLKGTPIVPITSEAAVTNDGPPLKAYDIRHVSKDENSAASNELHRPKTRCRFKRSGMKGKLNQAVTGSGKPHDKAEAEPNRSTSHESTLSHQSEQEANLEAEESDHIESMASEETAEPSTVLRAEKESPQQPQGEGEEVGGSGNVELELTLGLGLGFETVSSGPIHVVPMKKRRFEECEGGASAWKMELGL